MREEEYYSYKYKTRCSRCEYLINGICTSGFCVKNLKREPSTRIFDGEWYKTQKDYMHNYYKQVTVPKRRKKMGI